MNTAMWQSPFTRRHLSELEAVLGAEVVPPVAKRLACGDVGEGAMAEPAEVARCVAAALARRGFSCCAAGDEG
jgi:phosphopantothenoylcysteine decarboxylase